MDTERPDVNQPLLDFLSYYVDFAHPPRYAVLLDGPWGVGKSHLIKAFLAKHFAQRPNRCVYVSLFGIGSMDALEDAIFAAAYPLLGTRTVRVATGVGRVALKHLNLESDLKAKDLLKRLKADIYIFDDLERATLPVEQTMGYINQLVEHDGKKVVILANQEPLVAGSDDFMVRREKVVGRVFGVQANVSAAVFSFIRQIHQRVARPFLESHAVRIEDIYSRSGLGNLRILQQALWDFERVCDALAEEHAANPRAMVALLDLILPLAIEYKAARLTAADLQNRTPNYFVLQEGDPEPLMAARNRYETHDLFSSLLSNEVLLDLLADGRVDAGAIHACLDASHFFATPATEPAWRTVWNWQERNDDDVEAAIKQLTEQLAQRTIDETGELLHLFSLLLWLASERLIAFDPPAIVSEARSYVNDLLDQGRLEPLDANARLSHQTGSAGFGYMDADSHDFRDLVRLVTAARREADRRQWPHEAAQLLELVARDPDAFWQSITFSPDGPNRYGDIPVLAEIDPAAFVQTVWTLPPDGQRKAMLALHNRYRGGALKSDLADEMDWVSAVREALLENNAALPKVNAYRNRQWVAWFINPALEVNATEGEATQP